MGCPEREPFPDAGGKAGMAWCWSMYVAPPFRPPRQLEAPGKQYLPRQGEEQDTSKVLSQVSQEAEWSPRGGRSRSRWYFRCGVCTEANEDSVIERLNSVLQQWQMSTWPTCLVIWMPAPWHKFLGGECQAASLWGSVSSAFVAWEGEVAFCCRQWEPSRGQKLAAQQESSFSSCKTKT